MVKDNIISHNSCINGSDNLGGGLWLILTKGMAVQGNQFIENISYNGGGIYELVNVGSIISGNRFYSNTANFYGGGIFEDQTVGSMISGNSFYGNNANLDGGGIFLYATSPEISNNLIVNNKATLNGGGITVFDQNSQPQIINNTIVADTAGLYGGGICINSNSVIVMNTILWGNSAPTGGQIDTTSGKPHVVYCDVQGGWPGEGNIDADPQFVIGDSLCHLTPDISNPCVNSGTDSIQINGQWYYCPQDDYESEERPYMGRLPDMGADETQVPPTPGGIELQPVAGIPGSYMLSQNYPNPFNPSTTIEFTLPNHEFVTLKVYNILGEGVATVVSEKLMAGKYEYNWNAIGLASGVYFYKLETGKFAQTRKMLLIQ
jgi:parallel beta-helix repeat protein